MSKKSGWRRPPIGVEALFEDYDRQQEAALLASIPESAIPDDFSSVYVPPLTHVHPLKPQLETLEEEFERGFSAPGAVYGAAYGAAYDEDQAPQDRTSRFLLKNCNSVQQH